MAIDLVTRYTPYVDELFATESKHSLFTNTNYQWVRRACHKNLQNLNSRHERLRAHRPDLDELEQVREH